MKNLSIKEINLKVHNIENMLDFYENIIGLVLLGKNANKRYLGIQGTSDVLLILEESSAPIHEVETIGLYHMAFLLPTRKDLANHFNWLLKNQIKLGTADHGYSEALYLTDPEGNGIEIYWDKSQTEWDIRENGEIVGVTESLDTQDLLKLSDNQWDKMPIKSKIGHLHFRVTDITTTTDFYEALGFSLKYIFGLKAYFYAMGDYHHHIAVNSWFGSHLSAIESNRLGLSSYTLGCSNVDQLLQQLKKTTISYEYNQEEQQIVLKDPNGIIIHIK